MNDRFELGRDGPMLILVGVDGSRTSLRAASYAAGLARRQGSQLVVVHVERVGGATADAGVAGAQVETQRELSEDLARQALGRASELGLSASFRAVRGDPFTEIRRLAQELHADQVVIGASEAAGHRLIGSLGARLVRAALCPVTVVP